MAKNRSRKSGRCSTCGKVLPARKGRPLNVCPICGAGQDFDEDDALARRGKPAGEFQGPARIGMIVGSVIGLLLGIFFGALIYREKETGMVILLAIVYGLGFAFLGCVFGFMAAKNWTRR